MSSKARQWRSICTRVRRAGLRLGCLLVMSVAAAVMGCQDPPGEDDASNRPAECVEVRRLANPAAAEIRRGDFRFIVLLPDPQDAFYDGVRFDHSGIVGFAQLGGHTFIGRLKQTPEAAAEPVYSLGTVEEYRVLRGGRPSIASIAPAGWTWPTETPFGSAAAA
ncbi:MAG: hypothetical protein ACLFUJ_15755 [Phycisphaerae bacterium]